MARTRCFACGFRCEARYKPGIPECPRCEASDVELAVFARELPIDDPYWTEANADGLRSAERKYGRLQ